MKLELTPGCLIQFTIFIYNLVFYMLVLNKYFGEIPIHNLYRSDIPKDCVSFTLLLLSVLSLWVNIIRRQALSCFSFLVMKVGYMSGLTRSFPTLNKIVLPLSIFQLIGLMEALE